jgi:hypothetical protein
VIMPRACIALRLRARLCRFATATTEGVVNGAAGFEERKVRRLTAGGRWIRTSGSAREEIEKSRYPVGVQLILFMGPSPGSQPSHPVATPASNTAPINAR